MKNTGEEVNELIFKKKSSRATKRKFSEDLHLSYQTIYSISKRKDKSKKKIGRPSKFNSGEIDKLQEKF